ncbi:hypothtetical protein, conserved, putative [Eimeria tenella]|uniref:Hypothtetical protein, conserved, putative n=2 Tax=Eimeria TaxID=5800 RepID=U6L760_EIMTE|nr:hypothtetical protein, conserved, putative [Eimeria tenella]CDJ43630.1 hypothtetical protein, conserved, putative [Eimeria tenella]|eukprot:XP_013234379.1 hypothtetical protein, conserved, putative [Eimeria tenella]
MKAAVCALLRDLRDVCLLSWVPYYVIEPEEEFACLSKCLSLAESCSTEQQLLPLSAPLAALILQNTLPSSLPVRQQKDLLEKMLRAAKLVAV